MISLFLNTSSNYFESYIALNNEIATKVNKKYEKDLSKEALYEITKIITNAKITADDIDEIICVKGPGSFTGLRVGATIAKTMSYFLNKKLFSVSSLVVMASSKKGEIIVPIIDARRGYVYGAIFDKNHNVLEEELYIKLESLKQKAESYNKKITYVSYDEFDFKTEIPGKIENTHIIEKYKKEEKPMDFVPNYLKKTEAEENLK